MIKHSFLLYFPRELLMSFLRIDKGLSINPIISHITKTGFYMAKAEYFPEGCIVLTLRVCDIFAVNVIHQFCIAHFYSCGCISYDKF